MSVPSATIEMRACLLLLLCAFLLLAAAPSRAEEEKSLSWVVPVNSVAVLDRDDQGGRIRFPSAVFYDDTMKEIYVKTSNGRITVFRTEFGSEFFPVISLGKGRGVDKPIGLFVARDGRLFVGQGQSSKPPRLTILNAAFFPLLEIDLSAVIPGGASISPNRIALGRDERIYIAGGHRGVLVLDRNGKFLHWLKPEDRILRGIKGGSGQLPEKEKDETEASGGEEAAEGRDQLSAEMAGMPEDLRPQPEKEEKEGREMRIGPIQVHDVTISANGHIFLLSEETGKVYVYDAREEFLFSFGEKGGVAGKLSRPRGLAIDEKRQSIFVVDYMRHAVLVYNFSGRFLFEIGGYGGAPCWFNFPTDIAVTDQGYLVVADLFNQRVQVLEVIFDPNSALFGRGGE